MYTHLKSLARVHVVHVYFMFVFIIILATTVTCCVP